MFGFNRTSVQCFTDIFISAYVQAQGAEIYNRLLSQVSNDNDWSRAPFNLYKLIGMTTDLAWGDIAYILSI